MPSKHLPLHAKATFSRILVYLRLLFHPHGTSYPRGAQHDWCDVSTCAADTPDQSQSFPPEIDLPFANNPDTPPERLVDAIQNLKPFLPTGCELLGQGDLKIISSHPIDAGGFADVWVGERHDGTKVAIKSYRCHSSSTCLPIYLRLYKEALVCSRLNNNDERFVPFIGVYSTREHPFSLVSTFMDHQNLRRYLRDNQNVGKLELLLRIARGLANLHSMGVVHGNFEITNVLVDDSGHTRIAGLGTASILSTTPMVDVDRSFHGAVPEPIDPREWGLADTGATAASDTHAFAILAWEVFAGQPPFSNESVVAGVHSMLTGHRPARLDHPELSDRVWKMIKSCWKGDPVQRKTMTEVVAVLETEAGAHKSE